MNCGDAGIKPCMACRTRDWPRRYVTQCIVEYYENHFARIPDKDIPEELNRLVKLMANGQRTSLRNPACQYVLKTLYPEHYHIVEKALILI